MNSSGFGGTQQNQTDSGASGVNSPTATSQNQTGVFGSAGNTIATGAALANIAQGFASGKPTGQAQAAIGTAQLANKAGAFSGGNGANPQAGAGLGIAGGALGVYNGIQQGGVVGYGNAAAGALRAGSGIASLAGDSPLASTLGTTAGYIAAPLAVYSAVENYKSGATGSDALQGAEAGAAVGSIIPGVGTLIGGVVGGAVGAIASAFGPGMKDPETSIAQNLINATSASGNTSQIASNVQNPYLQLAGLMDERSSTLPMYSQYGRMGESKFANGMINTINNAYKQGTIGANSTPQDVYSKVVAPWVNGMGSGYSNVGQAYTATTQGLVQDMVSQYMNGSFRNDWQSIGGQLIAQNAPAYGSGAEASTDGTIISGGDVTPTYNIGSAFSGGGGGNRLAQRA